jgi:glutamate/tyrosine decarboxylase-like PLP-dependent enzyme
MECDDRDIRLKAFFVGAKGENADNFKSRLDYITHRWIKWRQRFYAEEGESVSVEDKKNEAFLAANAAVQRALAELMTHYEKENKYFSPHYLGHMLSECSLPATLGHYVALLHNPNNISKDASAAGLKIESESIDMLKELVHYPTSARGHFTSGGTVANLEAFYRAVEKYRLSNGSDLTNFHVFIPRSAHYSWQKCLKIFGLSAKQTHVIDLDEEFRMDLKSLEKQLEGIDELRGGLLVAVAGSTELGSMDLLGDVFNFLNISGLREKIWFHVDAAYGAFFLSCEKNIRTEKWFEQLHEGVRSSDSITLDPHKLAYVPYAAGVILVRDPRDYSLYSTKAAYVDDGTDWPGASTFEGSRPATGATAFWLSAKSIGLNSEGYGRLLDLTLKQKEGFQKIISSNKSIYSLRGGHTNLMNLLFKGPIEHSTEASNQLVSRLLKCCQEGSFPYRFSKTRFDLDSYPHLKRDLLVNGFVVNSSFVDVLRIVFMNPFVASKEFKVEHLEALSFEMNRYIKHDLSHTSQA